MTVKSSISLADEQHAFVKALVEAGHFPNVSAVLQRGVDLLRQRVEAEGPETAALRHPAVAHPRRRDRTAFEGMDTRLAGMIGDKRRAHGLSS